MLVSAFGSAGQRCSALRMLFVPHETADLLIEGLKGAMRTLVVGDPADPRTDIGPVIDEEARAALEAHVERLATEAKVLGRLPVPDGRATSSPRPWPRSPTPRFLEAEVFGPILHVVRYDPAKLAAAAGAAGRGPAMA